MHAPYTVETQSHVWSVRVREGVIEGIFDPPSVSPLLMILPIVTPRMTTEFGRQALRSTNTNFLLCALLCSFSGDQATFNTLLHFIQSTSFLKYSLLPLLDVLCAPVTGSSVHKYFSCKIIPCYHGGVITFQKE